MSAKDLSVQCLSVNEKIYYFNWALIPKSNILSKKYIKLTEMMCQIFQTSGIRLTMWYESMSDAKWRTVS